MTVVFRFACTMIRTFATSVTVLNWVIFPLLEALESKASASLLEFSNKKSLNDTMSLMQTFSKSFESDYPVEYQAFNQFASAFDTMKGFTDKLSQLNFPDINVDSLDNIINSIGDSFNKVSSVTDKIGSVLDQGFRACLFPGFCIPYLGCTSDEGCFSITVRDFLNGVSSALEKLFGFINGIFNDLIGKVVDPVLNPLLDFVSNLLPNLPLPEINLDFANIEGPSQTVINALNGLASLNLKNYYISNLVYIRTYFNKYLFYDANTRKITQEDFSNEKTPIWFLNNGQNVGQTCMREVTLGTYLQAFGNDRNSAYVLGQDCLSWETFTLEATGSNFGIKCYNGKYLSAQPNGELICDRDALNIWETFTFETYKAGYKFQALSELTSSNWVNIKDYWGKLMSTVSYTALIIPSTINNAESSWVIEQGENICVKNIKNGFYLVSHLASATQMDAWGPNCEDWSQLQVEKNNGKFVFKCKANGKYMTAWSDGQYYCNKNSVDGDWERFEIIGAK